ncbi:MAG: hypothetical protein QOF87_4803 [Pseudonocardiales bacterium]|nr:hypothetical protein [Pseudonocardiales bacterium]
MARTCPRLPDPSVQISLLTYEETAAVIPGVSVQVDDVDTCHASAVAAGAEIAPPLTDEPWGVRRFVVRDPDGHVVTVLSHPYRASGESGRA